MTYNLKLFNEQILMKKNKQLDIVPLKSDNTCITVNAYTWHQHVT